MVCVLSWSSFVVVSMGNQQEHHHFVGSSKKKNDPERPAASYRPLRIVRKLWQGNIKTLSERVIELTEYRASLSEYLKA